MNRRKIFLIGILPRIGCGGLTSSHLTSQSTTQTFFRSALSPVHLVESHHCRKYWGRFVGNGRKNSPNSPLRPVVGPPTGLCRPSQLLLLATGDHQTDHGETSQSEGAGLRNRKLNPVNEGLTETQVVEGHPNSTNSKQVRSGTEIGELESVT